MNGPAPSMLATLSDVACSVLSPRSKVGRLGHVTLSKIELFLQITHEVKVTLGRSDTAHRMHDTFPNVIHTFEILDQLSPIRSGGRWK